MTLASALKAARRGGVSAKTANLLEGLAKEFASPEAFFASTKGAVLASWRRSHPDSKRDLGAKFWRDFDRVRALLASPESENPARDPLAGVFETEFSVAELKTVLDMAEISQMGSLSVREILDFVETVRKRRAAQ